MLFCALPIHILHAQSYINICTSRVNYSSLISEVKEITFYGSNNDIEKYCYSDLDASSTTFGVLIIYSAGGSGDIGGINAERPSGYSVRCLKD